MARNLIVYKADEIVLFPKEFNIMPYRIAYGEYSREELLKSYFDGYPQIIKKEGSRPTYKIKIEKDIMVPMRDGVKLAVDIYRPDVENERFPTLIAWGMWGKDNQDVVFWLGAYPQQYYYSPLWDGTLEAGNIQYFTSRGYVVVIPDPRGVGKSEGGPITGLDELHNPNDIYDLIEWVVKQPWSNGRVGMIGPSSYSFSQLLIAQNPPQALKAIFPIEAWYPGETSFTGMLDLTLMGIFHGGHILDSTLPIAKWGEPRILKQLSKEELEKRLNELLEHPDIKFLPKVRSILKYPRDPVFFDALLTWLHPLPPLGGLDNIKIPIYIGATRGGGARVYYHAAFEAYEKAKSSIKKMIFLPPGLPSSPWVEYHDEVIRWYDYWLKDIDNGIIDEPRVKVFITGVNKWKFLEDWPPKAEYVKMYPSKDGLTMEQPTEGFEEFTQPALYEDPTVYALLYTSEPLNEDIQTIGWVAFYLEASIDKNDVNWFIDLIDISPDGTKQFVSEGWLRASYREIDSNKSRPELPIYKVKEPIPVPPNERVKYVIRMSPAAHVFKRNHKIGVIIRTQEDLFGRLQRGGVMFLPRGETVKVRVYFGENTYLYMPVTGK
jgi:predicted acyl esterase